MRDKKQITYGMGLNFILLNGFLISWVFLSILWYFNNQIGWLWSIYYGSMSYLILFSLTRTDYPHFKWGYNLFTIITLVSAFILTQTLFLTWTIISGILIPLHYPTFSLQFGIQITTMLVEFPQTLLVSYQLWVNSEFFSMNPWLNIGLYLMSIIGFIITFSLVIHKLWGGLNHQHNRITNNENLYPYYLIMTLFTMLIRFLGFPVHTEEFVIGWSLIFLIAIVVIYFSNLNIQIQELRLFMILLGWLSIMFLLTKQNIYWEMIDFLIQLPIIGSLSLLISYNLAFVFLDILIIGFLSIISDKATKSKKNIKNWMV